MGSCSKNSNFNNNTPCALRGNDRNKNLDDPNHDAHITPGKQ